MQNQAAGTTENAPTDAGYNFICGLADTTGPFAFKDIFYFCMKLGAGYWESKRLVKEIIGNINLGTTLHLPGN